MLVIALTVLVAAALIAAQISPHGSDKFVWLVGAVLLVAGGANMSRLSTGADELVRTRVGGNRDGLHPLALRSTVEVAPLSRSNRLAVAASSWGFLRSVVLGLFPGDSSCIGSSGNRPCLRPARNQEVLGGRAAAFLDQTNPSKMRASTASG